MSSTTRAQSEGTRGAPEVFSRSASGLVRDLSLWDAMWFGVLSSGLFFSIVYFFPYPQYVVPGINTTLMLVIATFLAIPITIVYAGLGSAMPRAGGDYLFQSRSISPLVGFAIPLAWAAMLWTVFYPLCALVIINNGLVPILNALSGDLSAGFLADIATWLGTTTGTLIATLTLTGLGWALTVAGVGVYRKFQRWVFVPSVIITFFTFVIVLLTTSTGSWQEHFNSFAANQEAGVTVDKVFQAARDAGWQQTGMNLADTLIWIPIMMGAIPFAVFAAEGMLGEVKGARNFRKMAMTFVIGAFIIGTVVLAFVYFLFERTVSRDFISAASFVSNEGKLDLPVGLDLANLTSLVSGNSLLPIALGIGFMASAFQLMVGIYMNVTRMLVSMGLDRSLPTSLAKVSERTRTPVVAATLYLALTAATSTFFIYNEDWYTPLISTAAISGEGILLFGCLAAVLLPIRNPRIYASSPVAKYRFLGAPLLQLAGVVGLIIQGVSWIIIMTNDKLGVTGAGFGLKFDPRVVVLAPLVLAVLVYFGWRAIESRRGVDSSLAFKEIPPE
jgi:amino acid transporter